jgi:hypothetical protein
MWDVIWFHPLTHFFSTAKCLIVVMFSFVHVCPSFHLSALAAQARPNFYEESFRPFWFRVRNHCSGQVVLVHTHSILRYHIVFPSHPIIYSLYFILLYQYSHEPSHASAIYHTTPSSASHHTSSISNIKTLLPLSHNLEQQTWSFHLVIFTITTHDVTFTGTLPL